MTEHTLPATDAFLCLVCFKGDLPTGLRCKRTERTNEFNGTCLRCCDHNHG